MFLLFGVAFALTVAMIGLLLTRGPLVLVFPVTVGLFLIALKISYEYNL